MDRRPSDRGAAGNTGREFERRVAELLALKGVLNLTHEKQFKTKRVDIYFETVEFGARRRYGVEC
jgi:hypothetical protein